MPDPIIVRAGVIVPADALEMRAVRASGPGGQNVNKVASKVELRVDLKRVQELDDKSRERLVRAVRHRLDSSGRLIGTSQRSRHRSRYLEDARGKISAWIARTLIPGKTRDRTRP